MLRVPSCMRCTVAIGTRAALDGAETELYRRDLPISVGSPQIYTAAS